MAFDLGPRVLHHQVGVVAKPPPLVEQPPAEIGLLERVEEVIGETANRPERLCTHRAGATQKRSHGPGLERIPSDAWHVAPRRPAFVGVGDPHRDDGELRVRVEGGQQPIAQVGGDDLRIVVEEREDLATRPVGTSIATAGDAQVLVELDQHHLIGHLDRPGGAVGHHDDFDGRLASRPPDRRDRRSELGGPVAHRQQDPAHAWRVLGARGHIGSLWRRQPRARDSAHRSRLSGS